MASLSPRRLARWGQAGHGLRCERRGHATPRQPSTEKLSGDRRPPAAGGHEPRGYISRVPSVALPPSGLAGGRAAPRERARRHCSRTVNKLWWGSPRFRPGTCRAAPQRPARFPRHRPPKNRYVIKPAGGVSPPDPRRGEEPAQCAAAAAEATAGGSRSAARPGAGHEDPPTTAPRAPRRVLSAHAPPRATPHRARGVAPISPTSVNWPRGEGERTDPDLRWPPSS